ncbi:MAG: hypothetical protein D6694_12470 [Gammaproteobacteria bacterium]|nr:MAG: hypothetical protein D6694_12470 [Gammaproteobacteria bacterium]
MIFNIFKLTPAFTAFIVIGLSIAEGEVLRREEMLPPAVERFRIMSEQPQKEVNVKGNQVIVRPRISDDKKNYWIPETIDEAIKELEEMLPRNIYLSLLSQYLTLPKKEIRYDVATISKLKDDLSQYLYGIWDVPDSKLGAKLYCIGVLEGNMSPFFVLAAANFSKGHNATLKEEYREDAERLVRYKNKCEKKYP